MCLWESKLGGASHSGEPPQLSAVSVTVRVWAAWMCLTEPSSFHLWIILSTARHSDNLSLNPHHWHLESAQAVHYRQLPLETKSCCYIWEGGGQGMSLTGESPPQAWRPGPCCEDHKMMVGVSLLVLRCLTSAQTLTAVFKKHAHLQMRQMNVLSLNQ